MRIHRSKKMLLGQSFGAGREKDVREYFRVGVAIATVGSAAVIALFCVFDVPIARLFGAEGEVLVSAIALGILRKIKE